MTNAVVMISSRLFASAKRDVIAGIMARKEREKELKNAEALEKISATLDKHQDKIESLDNFAIAYLATTMLTVITDKEGIDSQAYFRHLFLAQARINACLNEKSIPAILYFSKVLNGGTFDRTNAKEEAGMCIVRALADGMTSGADIANRMQDLMQAQTYGIGTREDRATWHSQGTQGSSTLRALLVLGVVRKTDARNWQVISPGKLSRLVDGMNGIPWQGETRFVDYDETAAASEFEALKVLAAPALALTHETPLSAPENAPEAPAKKAKRPRKSK